MARKAKELIKAATIATAIDKVTGKILGWAVKSNSSNQYYQVTTMIIAEEREFFCNCEAREWGHAGRCCHILAIKEMLIAKAELAQEEAEKALMTYATFETVKAEIAMIAAQPVVTEQGVVEAPIFPQATPVEVKRAPAFSAPTFTNRENYALTSNTGFSLLKR